MSFKGVLKYLIYVFMAGWMFLLGIVVGRGTSPVQFDTARFQERLKSIAQSRKTEQDQARKKVDLKVLKGLDQSIARPVPKAVTPSAGQAPPQRSDKPAPMQAPSSTPGRQKAPAVPDKQSLKRLTFKKGVKHKRVPSPETVKTGAASRSRTAEGAPVPKPGPAPEKAGGPYTIQVAAYKDITDANTQMAVLEKKGFEPFRVKGKIKGETWYRVRIGSFATRAAAAQYCEKLHAKKIKTLIMKK